MATYIVFARESTQDQDELDTYQSKVGETFKGMMPLSPQEIRRLLCRLLWRAAHPINHVIEWSIWRRTHQ